MRTIRTRLGTVWDILRRGTKARQLVVDGGRLEFVDAIRAFAILMMLQGHVIELTLADGWRDPGNALYFAWRHMRGVTAPVFFFASGLIVAYLLFRAPHSIDIARLKKNLWRGGRLIILGYLLQLSWDMLDCLYHGDDCIWNWALRTHVLHTIGVGIFVITALAYFTRHFRWLFPIAALLLMQAAFMFGPMVTVQESLPGVLQIFSTYVLNVHAAFPVLTWLGFPLAGALLGFLVIELRLHERIWVFLLLPVIGYLLSSHSWSILHGVYSAWWSDYTDWLNYGVFTYYRLGEVLMIAGIIGLLTKVITVPKALRATARETLGIYFLHSIVVYSAGMKTFLWHNLDFSLSILLALLLMVVFIVYAMYAPAIREQLPFMKYLK
ncbi:MAG: hypothetical protein C0600_09235 [Ignavibacteria bacterium]|nr:MAG: hypothetical protein C0600_09235 [Ignavibacteria bacterium]